MKANHTLVLGIGNQLMSDDGVGGMAVRRLLAKTGDNPGVLCLDGGTLGYLLVGFIEDAENLIVIDAAQMGAKPGEVRVFENEDMDRFLSVNPNRSVHEVGLSDLMDMALLADQLPQRRALIAIQPQNTQIGEALSDSVAQSLPAVCTMALELIKKWGDNTNRRRYA